MAQHVVLQACSWASPGVLAGRVLGGRLAIDCGAHSRMRASKCAEGGWPPRPGAGELHNNSRMTWGKAFIGWAPPAEALAALLRCNHRFAIDGCGPCSYGGILWLASRPLDLCPCSVTVHSARALQSMRTQQLEQRRHVQ
jgi:hypothetical protein